MVGTVVSSAATSFQIPAGTLAENTAYKAVLNFSARANMLDSGFLTADGSNLFDAVTEVNFVSGARLPGDYNRDDAINAADYVLWRKTLGQTDVTPYSGADGDGDGDILPADFDVWRSNFGEMAPGAAPSPRTVPEAGGLALALGGLTAMFVGMRCRHPCILTPASRPAAPIRQQTICVSPRARPAE